MRASLSSKPQNVLELIKTTISFMVALFLDKAAAGACRSPLIGFLELLSRPINMGYSLYAVEARQRGGRQ